VRSLKWLLLLQRSIFGERTMQIDCSCGFKCDGEGTTWQYADLVGWVGGCYPTPSKPRLNKVG
jgi:hypothetical protein